MKKYLLIFIFLTITSSDLFSQKLEGKRIILIAITSVAMQEYSMETSCFKNEIKIKFKFKDSVSFNKLRTDSTFSVLSKSLQKSRQYDLKNDTLMNLLSRVDSAIKANTVYNVDSIKINYNQFLEYEKLLVALFNSSPTELEGNNKNRIILDGTTMDFKFYQNDSVKFTAYAHSPNKLSNPLLYNYLTSTMDIYRKLKKNNFLNKDKTSGY